MRASTNPALISAFAAEMKSRRGVLGISQEALALTCEVNRTYIAKVELAHSQPTLSVLARIADGLNVSLPDLMLSTMVRYRKELKATKKTPSRSVS